MHIKLIVDIMGSPYIRDMTWEDIRNAIEWGGYFGIVDSFGEDIADLLHNGNDEMLMSDKQIAFLDSLNAEDDDIYVQNWSQMVFNLSNVELSCIVVYMIIHTIMKGNRK